MMSRARSLNMQIMASVRAGVVLVVVALFAAACSGESDEPGACDPCDQTSCGDGRACVVFDDANRCAELADVLADERFSCSPCLSCDTNAPQAYCCGER